MLARALRYLLGGCAFAVTANAQSAVPEAAAPTRPAPRTWHGTMTISGSYMSALVPGVNGTTLGAQVGASLTDSLPHGALSFNGSLAYQRTEPAAAAADQWEVSVNWRREVAPRISLVALSKFDVNHVLRVAYRTTTHAGVAYMLASTKRVKLLAAPGLAYVLSKGTDEGKVMAFAAGTPDGSEGVAGGVYEFLLVQVAPGLTLQQTLLHLRGMDASPATQRTFDLRLLGMVNPRLGLSIVYLNQYDSSIPRPVKSTVQSLNSGIQIRF